MPLEEYRKKRDFSNTTEPEGGKADEGGKAPIYVIQRHDASHLHYDLRLELEGVLKSWAVPKEPPEEPGVKRLAVQTEDHPIEYADFEGTIPEGEYGAGTVRVWDRGTFELLERSEDKMVVDMDGKRLKGRYCLVRLKKSEGEKNWLFFKLKGR